MALYFLTTWCMLLHSCSCCAWLYTF